MIWIWYDLFSVICFVLGPNTTGNKVTYSTNRTATGIYSMGRLKPMNSRVIVLIPVGTCDSSYTHFDPLKNNGKWQEMDILKKSKQYLNQHKLFTQGVPSVVFCFWFHRSTDRRPVVVPTSLRMLKQSFCWETHSCNIDDMPIAIVWPLKWWIYIWEMVNFHSYVNVYQRVTD